MKFPHRLDTCLTVSPKYIHLQSVRPYMAGYEHALFVAVAASLGYIQHGGGADKYVRHGHNSVSLGLANRPSPSRLSVFHFPVGKPIFPCPQLTQPERKETYFPYGGRPTFVPPLPQCPVSTACPLVRAATSARFIGCSSWDGTVVSDVSPAGADRR